MGKRKNIFVLGDSYSSYQGYNPEGYHYHYSDTRENETKVNAVEKTWWHRLAKELDYNVTMNDSFSGSSICNTVRESLTIKTSFVSRIDKYINDDFFLKNQIDTMFVFGGTNDSWINAPIQELQYSDWTDEDLKCVLPAFCYLLHRIKSVSGDIRTLVILNSNLKPEITDNMALACEKYGVEYVRLVDIEKEHGHPTVLGMAQIADQIKRYLKTFERKSVHSCV